MNLVDFVFELESQTDFLIEGLLGLFEVFHEYIFFIFQVDILLTENFELLKNLSVFLFVYFIVVLNYSLSFLYFLAQRFHFPSLVTLNLSNHCLESTL